MKRGTVAAIVSVAIVVASAGGYLAGRSTRAAPPSDAAAPVAPAAAPQVYTCSMHPQVRLAGPGDCPICEMPLVPAAAAPSGGAAPSLQLSERALAMARVETTPVTARELSRELRAVGKIEYNESSLATVTARVDGYAERLFVNFTGVEIKAGDHLAEVYSPELLVAQQELLIAARGGAGGAEEPLVQTARLKLLRLGLTAGQVDDLLESRTIADRVTLYSPIDGTVIEKSIVENSAFKAGDALYRVANLDTVWVYLDIYEYDLAWVRYGQRVEIVAEALPGRAFEGMVTFVQPIVNEESRTIRVPVHVENDGHALKPGMFVSATIRAALARDGTAAPTGAEGKYTCPMHPQVLRDESGACPICDMPLERIPPPAAEPERTPAAPAYVCPMKCEGERTYDAEGRCPVCRMRLEPVAAAAPGAGVLAVPVGAVLDSGTRRLVYVETAPGLFAPREVVLGPRAGAYFPVLEGLAEGDRVVTRGGFLIDSQFQITGQPSLFYPGGLMAGPDPTHGGADAPPAEHRH
jgi:Cu(I)/Ag(I) efflux system membrane fusion protein